MKKKTLWKQIVKIGKSNTKSERVKSSFYESINLDKSQTINYWNICGEKEQSSEMVVIAQKAQTNDKMLSNKDIGSTVRSALMLAMNEDRLALGLLDSVKSLAKAPEDSLFCIMAEPEIGDSATHMHEVLLEAYCYENGIYIVKVDSSSKLCRIIGTSEAVSCVLVQKSLAASNDDDETEQYSDVENLLVDHCEAHWDVPIQPIIQLPES